ncbi:MAG TPA: hypothetical protein VF731_09355 [Solirubrobacterales bacterium]
MARGETTTVASHQNVEPKRGRHSSPEQGACVVELASMLAEESFSDHPRSVCPVIAAYMRTVNDAAPEGELRSLLPYAAAIVGTRGTSRSRRERTRTCLRWAREMGAGPPHLLSWSAALWGGAAEAGALAARAALARGGLPLALELADLMIADGAPADPDSPSAVVAGAPAPPLGAVRE